MEEYVGQLEEEMERLKGQVGQLQLQQQHQGPPQKKNDQEMSRLIQEIVRTNEDKQKRLE